jgi:hypothetical protein
MSFQNGPRISGPVVEKAVVRPTAPPPKKLHPFAKLAESRARVTFAMKAGSTITGTVVEFSANLVRLVDVRVRHRDELPRSAAWVLVDSTAAAFVEEVAP